MTNNRNSNFQEIYQEELGIVTQDFIGLLEKHFENNDAYVLEDEINAFRAMLVEERYKISNKRIQGELNFDSYTVGLLNIYDELKRKASTNKGIDVFTILVTKHLDELKNSTENYNNVIPENIILPTEDTIRLLARYDALDGNSVEVDHLFSSLLFYNLFDCCSIHGPNANKINRSSLP